MDAPATRVPAHRAVCDDHYLVRCRFATDAQDWKYTGMIRPDVSTANQSVNRLLTLFPEAHDSRTERDAGLRAEVQ
jgi:hypothetical protein